MKHMLRVAGEHTTFNHGIKITSIAFPCANCDYVVYVLPETLYALLKGEIRLNASNIERKVCDGSSKSLDAPSGASTPGTPSDWRIRTADGYRFPNLGTNRLPDFDSIRDTINKPEDEAEEKARRWYWPRQRRLRK